MSESVLQEKSFKFALRIVKVCQYLQEQKQEFILSKKLLSSGTEIGAIIEEARQGENRSDFSHKLSIANKEAFRTNYWLRLLRDAKHLTEKQAESLLQDCEEIQKMLISSLKSTKNNDVS